MVSNYFRKFFNKEEQAAGEYVGFVSDNMKNAIVGSGSFEAGEHTYEVIGMGWIVPWSFASARSSQSQIDILGEEAGEEMQYMLIPYKCYKEEFQPEQILAQFNYASYEDLKKYAEKYRICFHRRKYIYPIAIPMMCWKKDGRNMKYWHFFCV